MGKFGQYSLLDSLDHEWIKLVSDVMAEVGPAAQTLGGILKVTNGETYARLDKIASAAGVPKGTLRNHLRRLHDHNWIVHKGRQRTRGGRRRRTATIKVTSRARDAAKSSYGILPWWAACQIRRHGRLPWCVKAVLSVVMARLAALKKAAQEQGGEDADDLVGTIENLGGEDRFRFGMEALMGQTGLARASVWKAKHELQQAGIVEWRGDEGEHGQTLPDILVPNWDFRIVVTSAPRGGCYLDFDRGFKSGR